MSDRTTIIKDLGQGIAIIQINRPKALNALNRQVFEELNDFFSSGYHEVSGLSAVVLTGSGEKAFVAGADIRALQLLTAENARENIVFGQAVMNKIEAFHVPVIAAVNGFALGGGLELAMACHLRYASPTARFGLPELKLGLIPGYGGTQRLVRYIGRTKALELMLTGDFIDAPSAQTLGLINAVIDGDLIEHCQTVATKINSQGPTAISKVIEVVNRYGHEDYDTELDAFEQLILGDESTEGIAAFLEKRKANFSRS